MDYNDLQTTVGLSLGSPGYSLIQTSEDHALLADVTLLLAQQF